MRGSAHYRRHAASGQPASRRVLVAGPIVTTDITHTGSEVAMLAPYLPRLVIDWRGRRRPRTRRSRDPCTFVDISGFTKMSERLARHGKVGAEEVTDAIGTCFEALLAVAYAAGGGLLKFGGDALLLLFTGDRPRGNGRAGAAVGDAHARSRDVGPARHPRAVGSCCACRPACTPGRSSASSSASRTASCSSPARP